MVEVALPYTSISHSYLVPLGFKLTQMEHVTATKYFRIMTYLTAALTIKRFTDPILTG